MSVKFSAMLLTRDQLSLLITVHSQIDHYHAVNIFINGVGEMEQSQLVPFPHVWVEYDGVQRLEDGVIGSSLGSVVQL